jgi:hypothetical protein
MEEDVLSVIRSLPPYKALEPNRFIRRFLQVAWDIIRTDLMCVFDAWWHMGTRSFHLMNEALTILLPKTAEAATIKDFWPISLIPSLGKLFSKVLENKLAPWLQEMVHHS